MPGASQVLHYEISDGDGYTFFGGGGVMISTTASFGDQVPCYFYFYPPNLIELYQDQAPSGIVGEGYIGGSWSYPSTNGILSGTVPGACTIDLNQSYVYTSTDGSHTLQDPNSPTPWQPITNLYLDLWTSLDTTAQSLLPLGIFWNYVDGIVGNWEYNVGVGTWPSPLINQTITFAAPPNQYWGTPPFAVSATASSGLPVTFTSLSPSVCTGSGTTVTLVSASAACWLQAVQPGNATYAAATPVTQYFYVYPASQTIAFGTLSNEVYGSAAFAVSATATSGLPVSFGSATPTICSVSGSTVTLLQEGTCTIQAAQSGNSDWAAATPVNQGFSVTPGTQTITFGTLPSAAFGASPTVSATATSGLTVGFNSQTGGICSVSGNTVTLLSVGTCTIQAMQGGNVNWAAAPNVTQSFSVTQGTQTITFGALPSAAFGTSPTVSASATSGLTVGFNSQTSGICSVSGNTVTLLAVGTCTVQATQGGNANWAAAPFVNQSFTVTQGTQTITFGTLSSATLGTSPTVSATATSGLTVGFNSQTTGTCTTSGATVTLLAVGTCTIQATQGGNGNWAAAPSVNQTFSVTPESQAITFGTLPSAPFGTLPTVTATATSGLAVSFTSQTASICTVSGTTVALLSVGTCTIQAMQLGNANWAAAPSVNQSFSVTPESQAITFGTLPSAPFGISPTVSATATSGLTVGFNSQTTSICTVSGTTVTLVALGTCTIQATQAGNSSWAAATPVDQSFSVYAGLQPSITSLSPRPAIAGGSAFTLTVNGSNFVNGATVYWNGTALSTTYVSGTELTTPVTAAMIATAGTASVTVTSSGATSSVVTFTITLPLTVLTTTLPAATLDSPYSTTITASGGVTPYTWSLTGSLPPGLTWSSSTATISGDPSSSGTFQFTVQVTDSTGTTASQPLTLASALPTLSINGGSNTAEVAPSTNVSMAFNLYDEAYGANDIYWAQFYLADSSGNPCCMGDWGRPSGLDLYDGDTGPTTAFGAHQSDAFCTISLTSLTNSGTDPTEVTVVLNFDFSPSPGGTYTVLTQINYLSGYGPWEALGTVIVDPAELPVTSPPVYQAPPTSAPPIPIPPPFSSSVAQDCQDIAGTWVNNAGPATYSIGTSGGAITSGSSATYDGGGCGTITWQISGSLQPGGTWQVNFSGGSTDACEVTGLSSTEVVTPGCSSASVTQTSTWPTGFISPSITTPTATWSRSTDPPGLMVMTNLYNDCISAAVLGPNPNSVAASLNGPGSSTTPLNQSGNNCTTGFTGPVQGTQVYYNFGRTSLTPGQQYTGVTASWTNSGTGNALTVTAPAGSSTGFFPLGMTHFTQYNTPYVNDPSCTGTLQAVQVIYKMDQSACYYEQQMLPSNFVTAAGPNRNGTGVAGTNTVLKTYGAGATNICYPWDSANPQLTFFSVDSGGNPITSITGAHSTVLSDGTGPGTGSAVNNFNPPNGSAATDYCATQGAPRSNAICPTGPTTPPVYAYSDALLLYDQNNQNDVRNLRSVQDLCPACAYQGVQSGSNAHIDMYNGQSQSCSAGAVGDYGLYSTIRLR